MKKNNMKKNNIKIELNVIEAEILSNLFLEEMEAKRKENLLGFVAMYESLLNRIKQGD